MRWVTRLTGLSADTVRAWERRHNAVKPERTSGNTRRYSALEVRRLLLLRDATRRGHSISTVAQLDTDALQALVHADDPGTRLLVERAARPERDVGALVEVYVGSLLRLDSASGLRLLDRARQRLERSFFVEHVLARVAMLVGNEQLAPRSGASYARLFVHHLHVLHGQDVQPGAARVLLAASMGCEMWALLAGLYLSGIGLDAVFVGESFDDLAWAERVGRCDAALLVGGAGAVPTATRFDPRPGHEAELRSWSELERWCARLVRPASA